MPATTDEEERKRVRNPRAVARGRMLDALARCPDIDGTDFRIAFIIVNRIDLLGAGWSWPSHESLARDACCSTRTSMRSVKKLVKLGWLLQRRGRTGRTSDYSIDWGKWAATVEPQRDHRWQPPPDDFEPGNIPF